MWVYIEPLKVLYSFYSLKKIFSGSEEGKISATICSYFVLFAVNLTSTVVVS